MYRAGANKSFKLSMKNGLPYLSRELFWLGMHDIAQRKAKRISGHTLDDLQEMLATMARKNRYTQSKQLPFQNLPKWSFPRSAASDFALQTK